MVMIKDIMDIMDIMVMIKDIMDIQTWTQTNLSLLSKRSKCHQIPYLVNSESQNNKRYRHKHSIQLVYKRC